MSADFLIAAFHFSTSLCSSHHDGREIRSLSAKLQVHRYTDGLLNDATPLRHTKENNIHLVQNQHSCALSGRNFLRGKFISGRHHSATMDDCGHCMLKENHDADGLYDRVVLFSEQCVHDVNSRARLHCLTFLHSHRCRKPHSVFLFLNFLLEGSLMTCS